MNNIAIMQELADKGFPDVIIYGVLDSEDQPQPPDVEEMGVSEMVDVLETYHGQLDHFLHDERVDHDTSPNNVFSDVIVSIPNTYNQDEIDTINTIVDQFRP